MESKQISFVYNSNKEWYPIAPLILTNVKQYVVKTIEIVGYLFNMILDHNITIDVQVENPTPFAPATLTFPQGLSSMNTIKNIIASHTQLVPDEQTIFSLNALNEAQFSCRYETTITYAVQNLSTVQYDIWFLKTVFGLNNPIMPNEIMVGDLIQWTVQKDQMLRYFPSSLEPSWELSLGWESSTYNLHGFNESDGHAIPTKVTKNLQLQNNITNIDVNRYNLPTASILDIAVVKFILKDKASHLKYFSEKDLYVNIILDVQYSE